MHTVPIPQVIWAQDLAAIPQSRADWLWHGFIARGSVTLLTLVRSWTRMLLSISPLRKAACTATAGRHLLPVMSVYSPSTSTTSPRFMRLSE
jgi:hypothetical protein